MKEKSERGSMKNEDGWKIHAKKIKKITFSHSTGAAGNDTTRGAETDSFPELPCGQCTSE
mgnify:CR=1 FL=1